MSLIIGEDLDVIEFLEYASDLANLVLDNDAVLPGVNAKGRTPESRDLRERVTSTIEQRLGQSTLEMSLRIATELGGFGTRPMQDGDQGILARAALLNGLLNPNIKLERRAPNKGNVKEIATKGANVEELEKSLRKNEAFYQYIFDQGKSAAEGNTEFCLTNGYLLWISDVPTLQVAQNIKKNMLPNINFSLSRNVKHLAYLASSVPTPTDDTPPLRAFIDYSRVDSSAEVIRESEVAFEKLISGKTIIPRELYFSILYLMMHSKSEPNKPMSVSLNGYYNLREYEKRHLQNLLKFAKEHRMDVTLV